MKNMVGSSLGRAAVLGEDLACVEILAAQTRFDWDVPNRRGETPLYNALEGGLSDIVDIILRRTKDYKVRTEDGATLGHAAVLGDDGTGKRSCVEKFAALKNFDGWNICDSDGNTPIMLALLMDRIKMVEILANCPRVNLGFVYDSGKYLEDVAR